MLCLPASLRRVSFPAIEDYLLLMLRRLFAQITHICCCKTLLSKKQLITKTVGITILFPIQISTISMISGSQISMIDKRRITLLIKICWILYMVAKHYRYVYISIFLEMVHKIIKIMKFDRWKVYTQGDATHFLKH